MRIGLFGGTFDPIHIGHLVLATVAMEEGRLDRVIFMPAAIPPHKLGKEIASPAHRYEMVKLATEREPRFVVSDWELSRDEVSYTIDTVTWLKEQYPQDDLFFIIGADMLADFPTWQEPEAILEKVVLLAVPRPGFLEKSAQKVWEEFPETFKNRIQILDTPELEIASTWIRNRILTRKSIHYLVPLQVEEYILSNSLYGYSPYGNISQEARQTQDSSDSREDRNWPELEERVRTTVEEQLSPKRYKHVKGVVETATKLAKQYGVSTAKIRVAAWLHDLAREWPAERLIEQAKRLGVEQAFFEARPLLHGPIAARLAEDWFGFADEEIQSAVKYHTCGRPGMTTFEKVLCLADAIEPGRDYEGVDEIRVLADESLEKALAVQFDGTIHHLLQRQKPVFINTVLARNEWWKHVKNQDSTVS